MAEYPKQESGSVRGTVCYRDAVTIREDSAPDGASQPVYDRIVHPELLAEVLQVSGGEFVRGKQVEARTAFVVSIDTVPGIHVRCEVEILTGPYAGRRIYVGRVHHESARSRPENLQLHCAVAQQT
jgi:hypothetical protein